MIPTKSIHFTYTSYRSIFIQYFCPVSLIHVLFFVNPLVLLKEAVLDHNSMSDDHTHEFLSLSSNITVSIYRGDGQHLPRERSNSTPYFYTTAQQLFARLACL